MKKHDRILVISDLHAPYCHVDSISFLEKLKKVYKPSTIINIGDEATYPLETHLFGFFWVFFY